VDVGDGVNNITSITISTNKSAIKILEEAIEMIKKREITQIALAWVTSDNSIGGDISEGGNNIMMWASLEHNARECYKNIVLKED